MAIFKCGPIEAYRDAITGLQCEDFFVEAQTETWRENLPDSPHKDTQVVYLNMSDMVEGPYSAFNDLDAYSTPILINSPEVQHVISDCMYLVGASRLGRVMLINLPAGGKIAPHIDEGKYCASYRRYHLPIVTNEDVVFYSGDESYNLEEGQLYELQNKQEHSVENNGITNRLHLVLDMQLMMDMKRAEQVWEQDEEFMAQLNE